LTAKALNSPARREAAGRYLSGLLTGGHIHGVLAEAIAEVKRGARVSGLMDEDIDAELEAWRGERKAGSSSLTPRPPSQQSLKRIATPEQARLRAVGAPNQLLLSQAVEDEYREVKSSSARSLIALSASNVASASLTLWSLLRSGSNQRRPSGGVAIRKMINKYLALVAGR
jgi:hypothetical protein